MADSESRVKEIIDVLIEFGEDTSLPRNVKLKVKNIVSTLNQPLEASLKVNKVLNELEEIADDINIQPYTRTQIWNIISMMEKV